MVSWQLLLDSMVPSPTTLEISIAKAVIDPRALDSIYPAYLGFSGCGAG